MAARIAASDRVERGGAVATPATSNASSSSDRSTRMSPRPTASSCAVTTSGPARERQEDVGGRIVAVDDHRFEQLAEREA